MLPRLALRHAAARGRDPRAALAAALAVLLDGRRRPAASAQALGLVDEVAPADALSHALGIARRIAGGDLAKALWSPMSDQAALDPGAWEAALADPDVKRCLAHHDAVPRSLPTAAILDTVSLGLAEGLDRGLAAEARRFGALVASDEGRDGIDRFLARRSWPLPLRPVGAG
jgi:3-hydroxyacyl-CoA dehydrogenase/enoyl-CoA hydratase/3-hydroxybutyryl-CoA epimerase